MAVVPALADAFVIEGARPLNGRIRAAGNKNGALPILAACVLTEGQVVLHNVPRILDVQTMLDLIADIGVDVEWIGDNDVSIQAANVTKTELDEELCRRIRASVLLAGPLLARFGSAIVPPPGGDVIGRRRVDTHLHAFEKLGATIEADRRFTMRTDGLVGTNVFLDEASVTGTENAVMAATLARGETVLGNAASEPHVQDLCRFLVELGADIDGIGTNVLRVRGVDALHGGEHTIAPDHIEVASFIGLGAITEGEIVIENCRPEDLVAITPVFRRLGIKMEFEDTSIRVLDGQDLVIEDDVGGHIPKIDDGPWPAFPGRPDVDRGRGRDAGAGHGDDLREDVREPAVLRRQARQPRRADHPLRSAPRRRHRSRASLRRADVEPRHPRRHGDAARGALRGGHVDDRERPRDRPRLRADRRAAARTRRAHRARRELGREAAGFRAAGTDTVSGVDVAAVVPFGSSAATVNRYAWPAPSVTHALVRSVAPSTVFAVRPSVAIVSV